MINGRLKVLVCPLDWGLGHATRCIPIIRELISQGAEVCFAGDGHALSLLKEEFPNITCYYLRGYRITFSAHISPGLKLILRLPSLIGRLMVEYIRLKKLVRDHNFNVVISDNRYGLWNKKCYTVFITHQLNIIPPPMLIFTAPLLRRLTRTFVQKYDECWIPDEPGNENISGRLSHNFPIPSNVKYIGLLSRFDQSNTAGSEACRMVIPEALSHNFDLVALLSGPEPLRSQLEVLLKQQLAISSLKSLLIRGVTGTSASPLVTGNLTIIDHLQSNLLESILRKGPVIICRGGYSTLMDLAFTGNRVICIPTPGQTEQEYLANKGNKENMLVYAHQNGFSLDECVMRVNQTTGIIINRNSPSCKQAIRRLVDRFKLNNTK